MILIRPLIRANAARAHNAHVVIFFIFLVANIGGALTPLGDPPLFVGFLRGVDFFWTAQHLWLQTSIVALLRAGDVLRARQLAFCRDAMAAAETRRRRRSASAAAVNIAADRRSSSRRSWYRPPGSPASSSTSTAPSSSCRISLRDAALIAHRARLALADARRAPRSQRLHLGADPRGRHPVRRHLRRHHPGDGDAASRARRQLRVPAASRHGARRHAARGGLFLADRRALGLPRQRADLSRLLRARRRRRRSS